MRCSMCPSTNLKPRRLKRRQTEYDKLSTIRETICVRIIGNSQLSRKMASAADARGYLLLPA